jgi:hypothetical protein
MSGPETTGLVKLPSLKLLKWRLESHSRNTGEGTQVSIECTNSETYITFLPALGVHDNITNSASIGQVLHFKKSTHTLRNFIGSF